MDSNTRDEKYCQCGKIKKCDRPKKPGPKPKKQKPK
jgi:hypothetical protein